MAKFANILETVGHTPVVKINKLAPKGINLYVKIEAFNPLGSVKDRLALGVIEAAEKSGELKPGQTVIEATSGNTGIGLAMVCAAKGYPLVVTMAESFSVERRKLMRFLGAKVVLTPAAERGMGMVNKAQELAKTHGWFLPASSRTRPIPTCIRAPPRARSSTTSRARSSTTGSPASAPAARSPASRACCARSGPTPRSWCASRPTRRCSPAASPQERNPDGSPAKAQPAFKPHPMQGWSPDFIPKITGEAVDMKVIDRIVTIAGADALQMQPRAGAEGRHLRRHHRRRAPSPARWKCARRRRPARPCSPCCPTPASAICRRRCLPTSPPT